MKRYTTSDGYTVGSWRMWSHEAGHYRLYPTILFPKHRGTAARRTWKYCNPLTDAEIASELQAARLETNQ